MTTDTAATAATATYAARVKMLKFWAAEIKFPAGRDAVRSWSIAGPFRSEIKALKKAVKREERRALHRA